MATFHTFEMSPLELWDDVFSRFLVVVKTVEHGKNLFLGNVGFFLIIPHVVKNYFRTFLSMGFS